MTFCSLIRPPNNNANNETGRENQGNAKVNLKYNTVFALGLTAGLLPFVLLGCMLIYLRCRMPARHRDKATSSAAGDEKSTGCATDQDESCCAISNAEEHQDEESPVSCEREDLEITK
jgi:hypothetical protein